MTSRASLNRRQLSASRAEQLRAKLLMSKWILAGIDRTTLPFRNFNVLAAVDLLAGWVCSSYGTRFTAHVGHKITN